MVARYAVVKKAGDINPINLQLDPEGFWVKYSDYVLKEKEEELLRERITELENRVNILLDDIEDLENSKK